MFLFVLFYTTNSYTYKERCTCDNPYTSRMYGTMYAITFPGETFTIYVVTYVVHYTKYVDVYLL